MSDHRTIILLCAAGLAFGAGTFAVGRSAGFAEGRADGLSMSTELVTKALGRYVDDGCELCLNAAVDGRGVIRDWYALCSSCGAGRVP